MNLEEYDALATGSGEAVKCIARIQAKQGKHFAVVERKYTGGSCPNIASFSAVPSSSVELCLRSPVY